MSTHPQFYMKNPLFDNKKIAFTCLTIHSFLHLYIHHLQQSNTQVIHEKITQSTKTLIAKFFPLHT